MRLHSGPLYDEVSRQYKETPFLFGTHWVSLLSEWWIHQFSVLSSILLNINLIPHHLRCFTIFCFIFLIDREFVGTRSGKISHSCSLLLSHSTNGGRNTTEQNWTARELNITTNRSEQNYELKRITRINRTSYLYIIFPDSKNLPKD